MKKGSYWFAFLSEKEQNDFMENCKFFSQAMQLKEKSFKQFMLSSFSWKKTKQGFIYWSIISNRNVLNT